MSGLENSILVSRNEACIYIYTNGNNGNELGSSSNRDGCSGGDLNLTVIYDRKSSIVEIKGTGQEVKFGINEIKNIFIASRGGNGVISGNGGNGGHITITLPEEILHLTPLFRFYVNGGDKGSDERSDPNGLQVNNMVNGKSGSFKFIIEPIETKDSLNEEKKTYNKGSITNPRPPIRIKSNRLKTPIKKIHSIIHPFLKQQRQEKAYLLPKPGGCQEVLNKIKQCWSKCCD